MAVVLLVEDNDDNRFIYRAVLEHHGYTVIEALDGQTGIAAARRHLPALILMDISMPVMDGLEATRKLKADPLTAGIPVVALTAHALKEDRARVEQAGCDAYIAKPVAPLHVVEVVRELIGPGEDRVGPESAP